MMNAESCYFGSFVRLLHLAVESTNNDGNKTSEIPSRSPRGHGNKLLMRRSDGISPHSPKPLLNALSMVQIG